MQTTTNTAAARSSVVDMLWAMLKPFDSNVRLALGKRLIDSAKSTSETKASEALMEKIRKYEVSHFTQEIPATGGETVPCDDNGKHALLEMKYGL